MTFSWRFAIVVLVLAGAISASNARGYEATPAPWAICSGTAVADQGVLERSLTPTEGATVSAGAPLTFSGRSEAPLTFSVASSPQLLGITDIAGGLGVLQPPGNSTEGPAYALTTTAPAQPGMLYWSASFSTAGLSSCAGVSPTTYTTQVRTLTVVPAVASSAPTRQTPQVQRTATLIPEVEIKAPSHLRLTRPHLLYRVRCTASCAGTTSILAFVAHRGRKQLKPEPALDLAPEPVSIAAPGGGVLRLSRRYTGRALGLIRNILKAGGSVELQISVAVNSANHTSALARRMVWVRP